MPKTPTTPKGLRKYDDKRADTAVILAWMEPGANPEHHRKMQEEVRAAMPVLARALDRLAAVK